MNEHKNAEESAHQMIDQWLHADIPSYLKEQIQTESPELIARFMKEISFGTSGMRALMGSGMDRINEVTIARGCWALGEYLKEIAPQAPRVVICFDNRQRSESFALCAGRVLSALGVKVYLTRKLRPVPYLSFLVRQLNTAAGIMITASHNPKEYNGLKVYDGHGGEITKAAEKAIEKYRTLLKELYPEGSDQLIEYLDLELFDERYLKVIETLPLLRQQNHERGDTLHIIYSSLYGTGSTLAVRALNRCGFTRVCLVEQECKVDPSFGKIVCPNPEDERAYDQGFKMLIDQRADVLLINDADADRVGVAIIHQGIPAILSGDEIAALCLYHLCSTLQEQGRLVKEYAVITTLVTTRLLDALTKYFGLSIHRVHTGFKCIAERMDEWEKNGGQPQFLFAAEESYGFLAGDYIRDKDGIAADCLVAEMVGCFKDRGKDLIDVLYEMYEKFGVFRQKQRSIDLPPEVNTSALASIMMQKIRIHPPEEICGIKVMFIEDYLSGNRKVGSEIDSTLTLNRSDVLVLRLSDETSIILRPSGTEPKLRIHVGVIGRGGVDVKEEIQRLDGKIEKLMGAVLDMVNR
jgi:phosphoglucomutase/phosphomannomutase